MPTQGETRDVQIEVRTCAPVDGNQGPQWQVEFVVPSISKFPQKSWFDRTGTGQGIAPGTYNATIERGKLKDGKDPNTDFNWYWNLISTHGNATAQAEPYRSATTADGQKAPRTTDQRIQRQVAFKGAVDVVCKTIGADNTFTEIIDSVLGLTDAFDCVLSRAPSAKALEDEPPIRDEEPPEDVIDESQENLPW